MKIIYENCGVKNYMKEDHSSLISDEKYVSSQMETWWCVIWCFIRYRKILKISPGAFTFQRPFLRGLYLEGLIFGGAYLRREICISKSIGLALQKEGNLPFFLCFTLYLRAISKYKPPGGLIFGGAI